MTRHIGVDWAGGVWVVVEVTAEQTSIDTEPAMLNVWEKYGDAEAILVDVPIGLPSDEPRTCDQEAQNTLGYGGSVFRVPARDAVYAETYDDAVTANEKEGCGGLGAQSWGLLSQIREVDVLLQRIDNAGECIYESHPEVCFAMLADEKLSSKQTPSGRQRRLDILDEMHDGAADVREFVEEHANGNAEWHHRIQNGRIDDVLDAAVMAFTGAQVSLSPGASPDAYPAFPRDGPEQDATGLPMEIVHPGSE